LIADTIVPGKYWRNGNGCALGCSWQKATAEGCHAMALRHGIPVELSALEDAIFEGIATGGGDEHTHWPGQFVTAIREGSDLSMVWPRFALWLLSDEDSPMYEAAQGERVKGAVAGVADLYRRWVESGTKPPMEEWRK